MSLSFGRKVFLYSLCCPSVFRSNCIRRNCITLHSHMTIWSTQLWPGWPDCAFLFPIGLLFEVHSDFLKRKSDPKKLCHFGLLLLLGTFFYIFTQISCFKTWFVVGILRFQKGSDVKVSNTLIELWCWYFDILGLGNSFGYFFEKLGNIFPSSKSPLAMTTSIIQPVERLTTLFYKMCVSRSNGVGAKGVAPTG